MLIISYLFPFFIGPIARLTILVPPVFGVGIGVGVLEGNAVGLLVNAVEKEVTAFDDVGREE